jgi:hypothetical protein
MSGNAMYLPADRVGPLGITMVQAMAIVRHIGVGSAKALRGADPHASSRRIVESDTQRSVNH